MKTEDIELNTDEPLKSFRQQLEDYKKENSSKTSLLNPLVKGHKMGKHPKTNGIAHSRKKKRNDRRIRNKRASLNRKINIHNRRKSKAS